MHILSSPVFLKTNRSGLFQRRILRLLKPIDKTVSTRSFKSFFFSESLYTGHGFGFASHFRSMVSRTFLNGHSPLVSTFGATSLHYFSCVLSSCDA